MIAILGSGFGLYGYLPALLEIRGDQVVLLERYRDGLRQRAELAHYEEKVRWSTDETDALNTVDGIVLARRPRDQDELVPRCLAHAGIKRLLLEKPLAPTPDRSAKLLSSLLASRRTIRIGYTFRFTAWAEYLAHQLHVMRNGTLAIRWRFLAHHFKHNLENWKRFDDQGGGALRFYGIQVVALLAEFGYRDVGASEGFGIKTGELERWSATFTGPNLPTCEVIVDSRSDTNEFSIEAASDDRRDRIVIIQPDPFSPTPGAGRLDRRVELLKRLCQSLLEADGGCLEWYGATNDLWRLIELRTRTTHAAC